MNILHSIETSGPGGAENLLIRTAQSLPGDYQSSVLLLKPGWLHDRLVELGFPVTIERLDRSMQISWLIRVARLLTSQQIDVIHSHEFAMNLHMSILAKFLGINHVATVHGKTYYGKKAIRKMAYRLVARLSGLVAVSEDIKSYLIEAIGVDKDSVTVIPNGIEVDDYQADSSGAERVRHELGLDEDTFLICAIGNLYEVKGHRFLINAIGQLASRYENIKLVIAGRGNQQGELEALINELEIRDQVELLGFRDDVKSILLASDLFVMPSLSEGLPLSLLEAMAAAVPVVVTSVGGMPQIVEDNVTGILVPPSDDCAIASGIQRVVDDPAFARKMTETAYQEVVQRYSQHAMLDKYQKLYLRP